MSAKDDAVKKITDTIEDVKKKAEPVIKEAKKKAEPVVKGAKKKAEPVVKEAKKQTDKAVKQAKKTTKDVANKVAEVTAKNEIFIQYGDYEIKTDDMVKRVREAYIAEGHKASDIHEVQIYIKPSDNCAYYVINYRDTGKVEF